MSNAKVVIIWRPNVGKSSLFNALIRHKVSIISDKENTTRDIIEYQMIIKEDRKKERWESKEDFKKSLKIIKDYTLIDSWWLNFWSDSEIIKDIKNRVDIALDQADLVLFVVESHWLSSLDERITKLLRKRNLPVILVANKADNDNLITDSYALAWLGFYDFIPVSVSHRINIKELREKILDTLEDLKIDLTPSLINTEENIKIALIWRPNVGKSSLVNALTWADKVMVKNESWTTRDAIDTYFSYKNNNFTLIDTAWIRRAWKIEKWDIEWWSVLRSERALTRTDIVAVIIDAFEWITAWDQHIVEQVLEENKWLILVLNKWDKVLNKPNINKESIKSEYMEYLAKKFWFLSWAPIIFTSAETHDNIYEILESATWIYKERHERITTGQFNNFLEYIVHKHPPTWRKKSHNPKIYYWSQVDINPPKFILNVNYSDHFHFSYKRYVENKIRENFWFHWTPIIIEYKQRWKTRWVNENVWAI